MKILLDENLLVRLTQKLFPYQVYHVKELGWSGVKNGKLLQKAIEDEFEFCFYRTAGSQNKKPIGKICKIKSLLNRVVKGVNYEFRSIRG
jgi:hypothetical protein